MNSTHKSAKCLEVDTATFDLQVLLSERPVLVAFAAPWSRPCQLIESVLDEIASSCPDKLKVVRVNVDDNPDLGLWYDIQSVPTLLYFMAGSVRGKVVGTATKAAILSKLEAVSNANTGEGGCYDA
jgi:thioredoxin 1